MYVRNVFLKSNYYSCHRASGKASYDTNFYLVAPRDEPLWLLKGGLGEDKMSSINYLSIMF